MKTSNLTLSEVLAWLFFLAFIALLFSLQK